MDAARCTAVATTWAGWLVKWLIPLAHMNDSSIPGKNFVPCMGPVFGYGACFIPLE